MTITDTLAEIKLQCLLDHTYRRMVQELNLADDVTSLKINYKWGFDGITGHSEYKQIYDCDELTNKFKNSIFFTLMVPIRVMNDAEIIFENPCPPFTRYCQLIRNHFLKETSEISRNEVIIVIY